MPTQQTIPCPQCGQATEVELWQVLDLARQPELRRRFLQGQINVMRCDNCGASGMMGAPLAIHDPAGEQVIFFISDDPQITPEIMGQIQADLGNALMRDWRGPHPDYLFSPPHLSRDLNEVAERLAAGLEAQTDDTQTGPVSETGPVSPPPDLPPELAELLAVLTEDQQETFLQILDQATDEESLNQALAQHPALLAALQQTVDQLTNRLPSELIDALLSLITASSLAEKQQLVEAQQDVLLSDLVEPIFEELLNQYQNNEQAVQPLQTHRTLLRRCRDIGIQAAFDELAAVLQQVNEQPNQPTNPPTDDLRAIFTELTRLTQLIDMPRRVELCRKALTMISRVGNERLWAALQVELGGSLRQNPQGSRAENIEQAIEAYQQALQVMTRQAMPVEWAAATMGLATAYANRIRGERADNIEQAIDAYQQALKVYTHATYPERWAIAQNNLANAYLDGVERDRADNIEKAIEAYQQALQVRTRQAMPVEWATTMMNLASAYYFRIRGERVDNIEQAINAYQQAMQVRTRQAMPVEWAQTMNNLANAYRDRIRGERANNIEQAIEACQQALQVRTRQAMPVEWAQTMNNLANAYRDRIRGERADNIEQAIHAHQQALQVMTHQAMPVDWAQTMNNLASAYYFRIRGERADNIEQAIEAYQQALQVMTRQAMPVEWATTMMNLANAYSDRIRGERADNIEQAIEAYQQALQVRTRQAMPVEWAQTMMNLASAYKNRIRGERADNIEQAIEAYQQALQVRTRQAMPVEWATTMMNLATAYYSRIRGERADNIEQAIEAYQQALQVMTRQAMPVEWATTMMNLANAYSDRTPFLAGGERADNIEQAIEAYQQALQVMTRQAMPVEWATTMMNLANAYSDRIRGERADNIEQAIEAYQQALQEQLLEQLPADHRQTQRNLGNLFFGERRWVEAETAYREAIEAGQLLLAVAVTDVGRRAEVAETAQLFARSAYCQLQQGQPLEALLTLEQGKTRLLTEALALSGANLALLPAGQQQAYQDAVERVRSREAELRLPPREDLTGFEKPVRSERDIIAELSQARSDLNSLIDDIRRDQPDFMPTGLDLPQLLALIPSGGALVAPLITSQGSAVFVLPHGAEVPGGKGAGEYVVWLDEFADDDLQTILRDPAKAPEWGGWLGAYFHMRENWQGWLDAIEATNNNLEQTIVVPLRAKLNELGIAPGAPLLLMPQGGLGLLPLHAPLLDDYVISYAPSGYALHAARQRVTEPGRQAQTLLSVVDPKEDITYAADVAQIFRNLKPRNDQVISLAKAEATLAAVKAVVPGQMLLDFFCHGQYGWGDPLESGLALADKTLTLKNLITDFDLSTTRLVLLWACETGITDIRQSPDEFVGLPAGFLQAGAPGVISTLWSVNQLSTLLLVEKFYQFYLQDDLVIPEALRQAQLWLRTLTAGKLAKRFSEERQALLSNTRMTKTTVSEQFRRFNVMEPHERPFEHPYYWAAFTFSGA